MRKIRWWKRETISIAGRKRQEDFWAHFMFHDEEKKTNYKECGTVMRETKTMEQKQASRCILALQKSFKRDINHILWFSWNNPRVALIVLRLILAVYNCSRITQQSQTLIANPWKSIGSSWKWWILFLFCLKKTNQNERISVERLCRVHWIFFARLQVTTWPWVYGTESASIKSDCSDTILTLLLKSLRNAVV